MKQFFLTMVMVCCLPMMAAVHQVNYTPDDETIFKNPERGFTEELGGETMLTNTKNHVIQPEASWFFSNSGDRASQTVVVVMYYLGNYRSQDLSEQILQGFSEDMQILRNKGFKCVLRFAYDWNSKNDATVEWTTRHITQLKPYLAANADVIYVLEAGFVGQWGEWYYSSHHGNETQQLTANRRTILEALLDAVPEDRFLLVRYPLIKIQYLGDENVLTATQAFTNTARAKLGHHNDAFLNNWGNDGTYGRDGDGPDDDPVLRQYIAGETLYVPNGGETNVESSSRAKSVYTDAPDEMSAYHWSFCGSEYSEAVTNRWRSSGIYDELNRKMGYRYQLVNAQFPVSALAGENVAVSITLKNVGYAPLYNARPVYMVLKNQSSEHRFLLNTDPRRWQPNGALTTISETITMPDDIAEGTYGLYLYMPDAYASLADDPRYAVRFANTGVWEAATGMNSLQTNLVIGEYTGVGQTALDQRANSKKIENGQLLIVRPDGTRYTATGLIVPAGR